MGDKAEPNYWIELIKVSSELGHLGERNCFDRRLPKAGTCAVSADDQVRWAWHRGGVFRNALDKASEKRAVAISADKKNGALKRLDSVAPLLRDARILLSITTLLAPGRARSAGTSRVRITVRYD
jgi:hypothetical protein